jgi:hypothetical protein
MPLHGVAQLFTNRAPGPRPTFKTFKPRQLVFRQRVAGAPPYDRTANARANAYNRSYHVETACEAMLLTEPYSGERTTFKRWSRE